METSIELHLKGTHARRIVEVDQVSEYNHQGRTLTNRLRWRHSHVIITLFRVKQAEVAYKAPAFQKVTAGSNSKQKGEAQLKITVIA